MESQLAIRDMPVKLRAAPATGSRPAGKGSAPRGRRIRLAVPLAAVVASGLLFVPAAASGNIADLGRPTAAVSPYSQFWLSGFHRVPMSLHHFGRPVVLFLGSELASLGFNTVNVEDNKSAAERWAVVKALDQFGTFAAVRQAGQRCFTIEGVSTAVCSVPTFDWTHARYRSRYIVFDHKDLLDPDGRRLQRMSATERAAYYRYARVQSSRYDRFSGFRGSPYYGDKPDHVLATVVEANARGASDTSRQLPLVAVGGYLQTASQILGYGDLEGTVTSGASGGTPGTDVESGLSFTQVRDALRGKASPARYGQLIRDVNAEANIITALICHADGKRPVNTCGRAAIRQILARVH